MTTVEFTSNVQRTCWHEFSATWHKSYACCYMLELFIILSCSTPTNNVLDGSMANSDTFVIKLIPATQTHYTLLLKQFSHNYRYTNPQIMTSALMTTCAIWSDTDCSSSNSYTWSKQMSPTRTKSNRESQEHRKRAFYRLQKHWRIDKDAYSCRMMELEVSMENDMRASMPIKIIKPRIFLINISTNVSNEWMWSILETYAK